MPSVEELIDILKELKWSGCFCEHGIGNPMMNTHSSICKKAEEVLRRHDEERRNDPSGN